MVGYRWPRVKYEKVVQKTVVFNFFFEFYIDPGDPGGHLGGSRTDSGGEKHPKISFFKVFHNFIFFSNSALPNKNPAFFPDLMVREIRYMLSGPGLMAKSTHEIKNEVSINRNNY